jgi:hypothetical protein
MKHGFSRIRESDSTLKVGASRPSIFYQTNPSLVAQFKVPCSRVQSFRNYETNPLEKSDGRPPEIRKKLEAGNREHEFLPNEPNAQRSCRFYTRLRRNGWEPHGNSSLQFLPNEAIPGNPNPENSKSERGAKSETLTITIVVRKLPNEAIARRAVQSSRLKGSKFPKLRNEPNAPWIADFRISDLKLSREGPSQPPAREFAKRTHRAERAPASGFGIRISFGFRFLRSSDLGAIHTDNRICETTHL